jgi:hypothetical protein
MYPMHAPRGDVWYPPNDLLTRCTFQPPSRDKMVRFSTAVDTMDEMLCGDF